MPSRKASALFGILAFTLASASAPAAEESRPPTAAVQPREFRYTFPAFGEVSVYRPTGAPKGVVLLLSDEDGWTPAMETIARALAAKDILVAGVSTSALMRAMETAKAGCNNPNYPLVDLARDLQHRTYVENYMKPVIVGYGSGATLTYASIAQWPNGGYQGAVSINPAPYLAGKKPWCAAPGFATHRVSKPVQGWRFAPNKTVTIPWTVMQPRSGEKIDSKLLLGFVSSVPKASLIELAENETVKEPLHQLGLRTAAVVQALLPAPIPATLPGQNPIPDMPITLVQAAAGSTSGMMAIAYSGDGGWVGLDRDLAAQIAAAGIPVVGVDSLSYFWSARTPQGAGRDLSHLIKAFSERWNKPRVLLIGYSFGADALPYIVDNMDADARARIAGISLLGLSATADFQFHLTSWLDLSSSDSLPTIPAITRLKGLSLRCVRGDQETDSACPSIPPGLAQQYVVPGGHHFDRNAPLLARIVLGQRKPGTVTR